MSNIYEYSVVELHGHDWSQGETLASGEGTAQELGDAIARDLDALIARCDTDSGDPNEPYSPALEINVTLAHRA